MTITTNPSRLPEQEPTSPSAVVLCDGAAWLRTGIDTWESMSDTYTWGGLRNLAAERGGATLFDLADLTTGLTEVQKEAVRSIESKFFTRGGLAADIRDAFPEAFGDLVTATWDPCDPDASPSELLRVAEMEGAHVTATRYGATRSGNVHHVERSVRIHLGIISDEVVIDLLLGGWTITVTAPKPADPTGGDPVVRASIVAFVDDDRQYIFFRAQDGRWSKACDPERGVWDTGQLARVGRLSAQTIAELMGGGQA